jgi:hypothetical protein
LGFRLACSYGWKTSKEFIEDHAADDRFLKDVVGSFGNWSPENISKPGNLHVGDAAPDFRAVSLENDTEVSFLEYLKTLYAPYCQFSFIVG